MPATIKIFSGLLALIALFSGWSFIQTILNANDVSLSSGNQISLNYSKDNDNDGLTNQEESYWNTDMENPDTDGDGFVDGEEVASGHNPLVAGPHDLLIEFGKEKIASNLTEKLSALITSGLYAGDLGPSASYEAYSSAIDKISLSTLYDGIATLTPDELKASEIQEVEDVKRFQEIYLQKVAIIIEKDILPELFTEPFEAKRLLAKFGTTDGNNDINVFFLSRAARNEKIIKKLMVLDVPRGLVDFHKKTIAFFQSLNYQYQSISQTEKDPIKALFALNNLQDTYLQSRVILSDLAVAVKRLEIKIESKEFESLIPQLYDPSF